MRSTVTNRTQRYSRTRIAIALAVLSLLLFVFVVAPASRSNKVFQAAIDPYTPPESVVDDSADQQDSRAPLEVRGAAPAVNPFSGTIIGRNHLVPLEMNDVASDVVLNPDPDVVATAFGAELQPLFSYANFRADGLAREDGGLDVETGSVVRIGGASRMGAGSGVGIGSPFSGGSGIPLPNRQLGPADIKDGNGEAGGADTETAFVFLPEDTLTGTNHDSSVSAFPAANGLTILADDSASGPLGETPGAQLALDGDPELVHAPEPATLLLLGSGLVAISYRLRRRTPPQ